MAILILLYYYYNGYYIWSCSIYWCLSEQGCTIKWSNRWMADVYRKGGRGNNLWLCISSLVSYTHSFFKILIPYWNFDPFIKSFKHFYLSRFVFLLHKFDIQKTINIFFVKFFFYILGIQFLFSIIHLYSIILKLSAIPSLQTFKPAT